MAGREIPGKAKDDTSTRRNTEQWLWGEVRQEVLPLTIGSFAMIVSSYCNQAVPRFLGVLIDPVSRKGDTKGSLSFASSIACLGLVGGTASFIRTVALNQAQDSLAGRLRKQSFEILLTKRNFEWFHLAAATNAVENELVEPREKRSQRASSEGQDTAAAMSPAEIGLILRDDVDLIARTITGSVANLFRSLSSCIFGTYNMLLLNPSLLGLSLALAPVVGTLAWFSRRFLKKTLAIQHQAALNAAGFLDERLNNIMMVKMSNREGDEVEKYNAIQDEYIRSGASAAIANGLSMGSMFALSTIALCEILLVGGRAVESKRMTHGQLISFGSYSFVLALGSAGIMKNLSDVMRGMQSAERLHFLLFASEHKDSKPCDESQVDVLASNNQSYDSRSVVAISTDKLCFSYRSNQSSIVIQNVSMVLSVGEVIGIVGENGAGKSTIASLLAGLYAPTSGDIMVHSEAAGGAVRTNYNELDAKTLSKLVQIVPQSPALFDTSIIENVRYSCPDASDERVKQALNAANCDFISKLERGLQYQVGRNGSRLSGGQRQRIGLARALLADPVLLVLDEPSSSLDFEGESAVASAISSCRASKKALLLITHSAKTLSLADRVVVLHEGRVAQEGTVTDLKSEKNSLLAMLMPGL